MGVLTQEISRLTVDEMLALLDEVWEQLATHAVDLSGVQRDELGRRLAAYNAEPGNVVSWDELEERLKVQ